MQEGRKVDGRHVEFRRVIVVKLISAEAAVVGPFFGVKGQFGTHVADAIRSVDHPPPNLCVGLDERLMTSSVLRIRLELNRARRLLSFLSRPAITQQIGEQIETYGDE